MKYKWKAVDLSKIKTISIKDRENLVSIHDFADIPSEGDDFIAFLSKLPKTKHRTNAGDSLRDLVKKIYYAKDKNKPVLWALGPHVIKYGLSSLIIELMKRGFISAILTTGAGAIHDTEIALIGETSEEMSGQIVTGKFGMAYETGEIINTAAKEAYKNNEGFGYSLGKLIIERDLPYKDYSIIANAYKLNIPVTIHVAIGTDIIHMHPTMDGAATGFATFFDFRLVAGILKDFGDGGVFINIASAVILPEILVKSLTIANNLTNGKIRNYTTANFDHLSEYRPLMNVVRRSTIGGGVGYEIIGRIEIIIPLLANMLINLTYKNNLNF